MPEGPEVRRVTDQLRNRLVGTSVYKIDGLNGRYAKQAPFGYLEFVTDLAQKSIAIEKIDCKGKFIYWTLGNDWYIWNTLGMSGTWSKNSTKHESIRIHFSKFENEMLFCGRLSFIDARHFGTIKFVRGKNELDKKLQSLGYDWLEKEHSVTALWHWLHSSKATLAKPIGSVLMDQSFFAGVGNYIRAEALYAAGVSPWRLTKDVTYGELGALCKALREIMVNSYQSGGATIATYRDTEGNVGSYSSKFAVYQQKKDPHGNEVTREQTPDGRTIHWVKALQK